MKMTTAKEYVVIGRDGVSQLTQYLHDHWILVPLGLFLFATLAIASRKDRGDFLFKKRADVTREQRAFYDLFHILKYIVIALAIINFFIKFLRGDYS